MSSRPLLASCGLLAGPDSHPGSPAATGGTGGTADAAQSAAGTPDADAGDIDTPTPTPTPTPGKGPGCAAVRCTSVLVTGDMLVHPQLWQQAREDARAAGAAGLDFAPLLEGQRRYIEQSDLAICHLETPVAGPGRTVLRVPFLQRSAADHHRRPAGGLSGLHHGQQPHR